MVAAPGADARFKRNTSPAASSDDLGNHQPCWCTRVIVPATLVASLPEAAKGATCLCAGCIAGAGRAPPRMQVRGQGSGSAL
ncbi:MAG: cysteine-rich CWC family protein [Betaproteobacteria bacterium]